MNLAEAIQEYLDDIEGSVRLATFEAYEFHVETLIGYFGAGKDVTEIKSRDLRGYRKVLSPKLRLWKKTKPQKKKWGVSTKNDILGSVRRFFKFLVDDGILQKNPSLTLKDFVEEIDEIEVEPKAILQEELDQFLAYTEERKPQLYALATLLADTGCRISEALGLRIKDVDLESKEIRVKLKGGKRATIFISSKAKTVLESLMNERKDFIFVSSRGRPLMRATAYKQFMTVKERAGIPGFCNPHAFRHYFAKKVLDNGGSLNDLKHFLNHSTIQTTAKHYAVWTRSELRKRKEKFAPFGG